VKLSHSLLHPPNLPLEPLSTFPILTRRRSEFPLMISQESGQLFPQLALPGVPLGDGAGIEA